MQCDSVSPLPKVAPTFQAPPRQALSICRPLHSHAPQTHCLSSTTYLARTALHADTADVTVGIVT